MSCTTTCSCTLQRFNTGTACNPIMEVAKKLLAVPLYKEDGTRNGIDLTGTINEAFFTTWINAADPLERLYPLPTMKNINDTRGDDVREEFADNSYAKIQEGPRTFEGFIVGSEVSPQLKGQLDKFSCNPMGFYIVDRKSSIYGMISSDGNTLYPIIVDEQSISAKLVPATDTTVAKIQFSFQFSNDESDACIRMITADELGGTYLLSVNGLRDVDMSFSGISQTGVTVTLKTRYGSALTKVPVTGLVAADFISSTDAATSRLRNVTDSANVTISGLTETADGVYALTFSSQTVADVIRVLCKKNGYAFTAANFTVA